MDCSLAALSSGDAGMGGEEDGGGGRRGRMKGRRKTRQGLVLTRKSSTGILACRTPKRGLYYIISRTSRENHHPRILPLYVIYVSLRIYSKRMPASSFAPASSPSPGRLRPALPAPRGHGVLHSPGDGRGHYSPRASPCAHVNVVMRVFAQKSDNAGSHAVLVASLAGRAADRLSPICISFRRRRARSIPG